MRERMGKSGGPGGDRPRLTPEQRKELQDKWDTATPEERQKIREQMRERMEKRREARDGDGKGPRGERPMMTPEQRKEMHEKMQNATPEERRKMREEFREKMKQEHGARGPREGKGPNAPARPDAEHKH